MRQGRSMLAFRNDVARSVCVVRVMETFDTGAAPRRLRSNAVLIRRIAAAAGSSDLRAACRPVRAKSGPPPADGAKEADPERPPDARFPRFGAHGYRRPLRRDARKPTPSDHSAHVPGQAQSHPADRRAVGCRAVGAEDLPRGAGGRHTGNSPQRRAIEDRSFRNRRRIITVHSPIQSAHVPSNISPRSA